MAPLVDDEGDGRGDGGDGRDGVVVPAPARSGGDTGSECPEVVLVGLAVEH